MECRNQKLWKEICHTFNILKNNHNAVPGFRYRTGLTKDRPLVKRGPHLGEVLASMVELLDKLDAAVFQHLVHTWVVQQFICDVLLLSWKPPVFSSLARLAVCGPRQNEDYC